MVSQGLQGGGNGAFVQLLSRACLSDPIHCSLSGFTVHESYYLMVTNFQFVLRGISSEDVRYHMATIVNNTVLYS